MSNRQVLELGFGKRLYTSFYNFIFSSHVIGDGHQVLRCQGSCKVLARLNSLNLRAVFQSAVVRPPASESHRKLY